MRNFKCEVIGQEKDEYISNEVSRGMNVRCETDKIEGEDIFISETQDEINKKLLYKIAKLLNREA